MAKGFARGIGGALTFPHRVVEAVQLHQLGMFTALGDDAILQHQNLIGADHGGQPVGDDQRRAVLRDIIERGLNFALGMGIERRGASSRIRIGGDFSKVRAMATRCFSPPESFRPRSPTSVS